MEIAYINDLSIGTFFHELTHLLSYHFLRYQIPNEYYSFRRNFLTNQDNTGLIVHFLDLCERKKTELLQEFNSESVNDYNIKDQNTMNGKYQEPQSDQFNLIWRIEGIVDAIYAGQSFTYGLVSTKDNNSIALKAKRTVGHGCEYFSNTDNQFEEILANYLAIKLIDPNNELFTLLKNILGIEFVSFLDQRCNEICGQISKIEINNNISRK